MINRLDTLEAMLVDILTALDNGNPIAIKDATGADLLNGILHVKDTNGREHSYDCVGGQWELVNGVWGCAGGSIAEI